MRRLLPIVLTLGLLAAACGGDDGGTSAADDGGTSTAGDDGAAEGTWPHDFVADTIDGGTVDAATLAGDDLMLWFWAPW